MTHEDEAPNHESRYENETLDHELGTQDDDLTEPERYETATDDWQSPELLKFQNLLADYRKNHPEEFCRESMFTTKPARRWQQAKDERRTPKAELFGPMWRTGELAVLFGETGAGKSILAVQIAESIARAKSSPPYEGGVAALRGRGGSLTPQNVLYLDLEHTAAQFDERYSCPSPIPGKLPVKYDFSTKLHRTGFGNLEIPEAFQGNHSRYFMHSLNLALEQTGASVIVIDDLSWFDTKASGAASAARTLRDLKFFCLKTGASVLVLHTSPPCLRGRSSGIRIPRTAHRIYEPADSVFAIARSVTFAEDFRYIKHLKSNSSPRYNGGAARSSSPPYEGGVAAAAADGVVLSPNSNQVLTYNLCRSSGFTTVKNEKRKSKSSESLSLSTFHSPLSVSSSLSTIHYPLSTALPFLGLNYLGVAAESELLRDYEREFQNAKRIESRRAQRTSKEILVDGILDGSYFRYLKGE